MTRSRGAFAMVSSVLRMRGAALPMIGIFGCCNAPKKPEGVTVGVGVGGGVLVGVRVGVCVGEGVAVGVIV